MNIRIHNSVGKQGKNTAKDVKVVQALLNAYFRNNKMTTLIVDGKCGPKTIASISDFQKSIVKLSSPDGRVDPGGKTFRALVSSLQNALKDGRAMVKPTEGIITFEAEGMEGGLYHSRILHVPGSWSGVTIGRGYDMGMKSTAKITRDLVSVSLDTSQAAALAKANTLKGEAAKQFIIENDLLDFQITPQQQKELFIITYKDEEKVAKEVCNRKAVVNEYGKCDWDNLNNKIKQIIVDLKYRGDYTRRSRKFLQPYIVDNDLVNFKKQMLDKNNWKSAPKDRFERRKAFLEK
jgi:peptidoglycan hydrolase-like protein with peptidoglycan-binding domain